MRQNSVLTFSLFIFLSASCQFAFGQQLFISYDFITRETIYLKNGDTLKNKITGKPLTEKNQPKVRKGDTIAIQVNNLNPFVLGCTIHGCDSSSFQLSSLSSAFGLALSALPGLSQMTSMGGAIDLGSCLGPKSDSRGRGSGSNFEWILMDAKDSLRKITNSADYKILQEIDDSIINIKPRLREFVKHVDTIKHAGISIQRLIYNTHLSEKQIKDSVDDIILGSFSSRSLDDSLLENDLKLDFGKFKDSYVEYIYYLDQYQEIGTIISHAISKIDSVTNEKFRIAIKKATLPDQVKELRHLEIKFGMITRKMQLKIADKYQIGKLDTSAINGFLANYTLDSLPNLINGLLSARDMLYKASFTVVKKNITATHDFKIINISFYSKDSSGYLTSNLIDSKNYVFQFGRAVYSIPGIGICFSKMFQPQYQYANNNGTITSSKGDFLIPSVIVNYSVGVTTNNKMVGYGGSFGVGISLRDAGISFHLGPSLILSNKQKFVITAGIMTTQMIKLANGAIVGKVLNAPDSQVPTKKVYGLGYFLSLTYVPGFR